MNDIMTRFAITQVSVVMAHDLPGFSSYIEQHGFDSVSYGDAELTLITPEAVIEEIDDFAEDFPELMAALEELAAYNEGLTVDQKVLVGLAG